MTNSRRQWMRASELLHQGNTGEINVAEPNFANTF
jgi:hypothetical protein